MLPRDLRVELSKLGLGVPVQPLKCRGADGVEDHYPKRVSHSKRSWSQTRNGTSGIVRDPNEAIFYDCRPTNRIEQRSTMQVDLNSRRPLEIWHLLAAELAALSKTR